MASVHQQDDDPEKIIDSARAFQCRELRLLQKCWQKPPAVLLNLTAQILQEALAGQRKIPQQRVVCCPSTSEAYQAIADYFRQTSVLLPRPFSSAYERVATSCRLRQIYFDLRQEQDF